MAFHTDYSGVTAAPVSEAVAAVTPEEKAPQPSQVDWGASPVRGWTERGEEARALAHANGEKAFFTIGPGGGLIYYGKEAFAVLPQLREKVSMGRRVGFVRVSDGADVLIIGAAPMFRGVTPAWTGTTKTGKAYRDLVHCPVIDAEGNAVPLRPW